MNWVADAWYHINRYFQMEWQKALSDWEDIKQSWHALKDDIAQIEEDYRVQVARVEGDE